MTATSELILSTKVSPHQGSITVFFVAGNSKPVEVLGTSLVYANARKLANTRFHAKLILTN